MVSCARTLPRFIAIGASGAEVLDDICTLLALMPKPASAIVMVVLHRPSDKLSRLRDVLALKSGISIVTAVEAEHLEQGVEAAALAAASTPRSS